MDNSPYFTGLVKASHGNIQVDNIYNTQCSVYSFSSSAYLLHDRLLTGRDCVTYFSYISRAYYRVGAEQALNKRMLN